MIEFTKEEIEKYKLSIPTHQEIDNILENIDLMAPTCGTNSGSQINPNAFCACSRENPSATPSCQPC